MLVYGRSKPVSASLKSPRPVCGWVGFLLGAVSLVTAVTMFWAGPFAPQPTAGVSLGELTAEIGKSAVRNLVGLKQPAPLVVERDIDDFLEIGVAVFASFSIVLGFAGFIRRESLRLAIGAGALGACTIAFQFFVWYSLALICVLVIWAIYQGFGEAASGIFE